jgi:hypothetical protein
MLSTFILGCIEPCADILAIPFLVSCCIPVFDLQVVPEQVGLSQVFPSQILPSQVSGVQVVKAIDISPSYIDMVISGTDIDASDIDISEVNVCDAFPDASLSCLLGNLPNATTEAPRTKTLATPNQTFGVFIFCILHLTIRHNPWYCKTL